MRLVIVVPGEVSTKHRHEQCVRFKAGRPYVHSYQDTGYKTWKARVRRAGEAARPDDWPMHATGPRGGKLPMLYAVRVTGYACSSAYDVDNLRGAIDALEGVLWPNDRRCRPVSYDIVTGCEEPQVVIDVIAWDPRTELVAPVHVLHSD